MHAHVISFPLFFHSHLQSLQISSRFGCVAAVSDHIISLVRCQGLLRRVKNYSSQLRPPRRCVVEGLSQSESTFQSKIFLDCPQSSLIRQYAKPAMAEPDPYLRHLFDGTDLNVYDTNVMNLSAGAPGPDLLKLVVDLFQEATAHCLAKERDKAYLFQYGIASGLWEFREALAQFLTKQYGDTVLRELLVQTCGATHGLQMAMIEFLWPDSIIFVEDATYMLALQAFQKYPHMKIVTVPITENGLDVDAFEKIITAEYSKRRWNLTEERPFWAMLYSIPIFHNPTGTTMKESTCQKVVDLARKFNILVFCEDVYNLIHYNEGNPPKRLFAYDFQTPGYKGGHVISNGTFSKILSPGVRVGWLELPPRLALILRKSGILISGGATNHYVSGVITSLLELGLQEKHLIHSRNMFKARMDVLCQILQDKLPNECHFHRPSGGYFIWIQLPEFVNAIEFTSWSTEKHKLTMTVGSRFSLENKYNNYLRVSIAFHDVEIVAHAAEVLCVALREYIDIKNPNGKIV